MAIYRLTDELWFPEPEEYEHDIVAVGGDLSPQRLLLAYSMGIFPWYNKEDEILWWCPARRSILFLDELRVSHSMRTLLNGSRFGLAIDTSFSEVIVGCRSTGDRADATWIHQEVVDSYTQLHQSGLVHSAEAWSDGELAGGLYGVSLGAMFCGESMFSRITNASKFALIGLAVQLKKRGIDWIDCQVQSAHLASLGAREIDRKEYLELLNGALEKKTMQGSWSNWMGE